MHMLVAVDESLAANTVINWVRAFPHPPGTTLTIAHVIEPFDAVPSLPGEPRSVVERRRADQAQAVLERTAVAFRNRYADIKCALRLGSPIYELLKLIRDVQPDVVICGTRGLQAARGMVLGSVSQRLLSYAPCSVLVVPAKAKATVPLQVLFATDGSRGAKTAAEIMVRWPKVARIGLVTVIPPVDAHEVRLYQRETKQSPGLIKRQIQLARHNFAKRALEATSEILGGGRAAIHTRVLVGRPADVLPQEAARQRSGLLVLGSRGLTGKLGEVLGSVSSTVAQRAGCPVLVVKRPIVV